MILTFISKLTKNPLKRLGSHKARGAQIVSSLLKGSEKPGRSLGQLLRACTVAGNICHPHVSKLLLSLLQAPLMMAVNYTLSFDLMIYLLYMHWGFDCMYVCMRALDPLEQGYRQL